MKKYIALSILGLLIMAFSATVYAQPKLDFKASGSFTMDTFWHQNVPSLNWNSSGGPNIFGAPAAFSTPDAQAWNRPNAWVESEAHLKFDAIMGKELSGTIVFEIGSNRWGETGSGGDQMGGWTTDRTAVQVKHCYFDVALPYFGIPVPISMRFGAQELAMRPFVFLSNDGAGITGTIKVDPVNVDVYWFKAIEGVDWAADDVDVYGLHANTKIGPVTAGGYGFYYNMNTFPLDAAQDYRADMLWLGVYADGKAGPVDINFDFIYDTGKVQNRAVPSYSDVKYRGWMTKVKIDYPIEVFNFGVQGLYGSGADRNKTDAAGLANGTNTKVGSYVVPPASEAGPASWYASSSSVMLSLHADSSGGIGFANNINYGQMGRGPAGGIWWAKLYGSYKATPWYKVTLQGLYIGDTTKNGNTIGTAHAATASGYRDDNSIGWELDLINDIEVYKNLTFNIAAGLLIPGDALAMWNSATGTNDKFSTPWAFSTNLTYSF